MPRVKRKSGVVTTILTGRAFNAINNDKSHGFIQPDEGEQELFFHRSMVEGDGMADLSPGDRVTFEVAESNKGPRAVKVRRIL